MQIRGPKPALCEYTGFGQAPTLCNPDQISDITAFLAG